MGPGSAVPRARFQTAHVRGRVPLLDERRAVVLCVVAVAVIVVVIRDMVLGSDDPHRGWVLGAVPVVVLLAVLLNALAELVDRPVQRSGFR